jgi:hypothetical protein
VISAHRKLRGSICPAFIALAAILLVTVLLFAFPWVSGWIAFALPFLTIGFMTSMALAMNLRWTLWHGRRPLFFSIADLGFLLCFGAFAVYGLAYVADAWTNLPYVLVAFVLTALVRVAYLEFEAWWLGILLCGGLALVFGPFVAWTVSEPEWFFDFSASLLLVTGIILILAGSTLSLLESPRSPGREQWPGWLRTSAIALGLSLTVSLVASAALTIANRETISSSEATGARRVEFDGGRTDLRGTTWPQGPVHILVSNHDLRVHTFTVEELGIDVVVGPKSEKLIQADLAPGDYRFECRVPGHSEAAAFHVE